MGVEKIQSSLALDLRKKQMRVRLNWPTHPQPQGSLDSSVVQDGLFTEEIGFRNLVLLIHSI